MDTHGDRRVTFKYVGNAAIDPEVAEVLKRFDVNGDGTVSASDLVAGASALQQLRSANHLLRRVVLMLFVVAVVVLLGSFGCTMWAIDLSKEIVVSGDELVTSDGGAVRVNSSDVEVVDGKLRHRSASRQLGLPQSLLDVQLWSDLVHTSEYTPELVLHLEEEFGPNVPQDDPRRLQGKTWSRTKGLGERRLEVTDPSFQGWMSGTNARGALLYIQRSPGKLILQMTSAGSSSKRRQIFNVYTVSLVKLSVVGDDTPSEEELLRVVGSGRVGGLLGHSVWFEMDCLAANGQIKVSDEQCLVYAMLGHTGSVTNGGLNDLRRMDDRGAARRLQMARPPLSRLQWSPCDYMKLHAEPTEAMLRKACGKEDLGDPVGDPLYSGEKHPDPAKAAPPPRVNPWKTAAQVLVTGYEEKKDR